ncbi:MAG: transposase [Flavobacteriaceae bacterium]|nr:transposase [Flavobacteriaceae bacterium]
MPKEKRYQVETITTEVSWSYIHSARKTLPKAKLFHDRLLGVPYLKKTIDRVHRREVKKRAVLKNTRLAILINEENRTEKQRGYFKKGVIKPLRSHQGLEVERRV